MSKAIRSRSLAGIAAALFALFAWGCCGEMPKPPAALPSPPVEEEEPPAPAVLDSYAGLERAEFNRLAARLDLPLFWRADDNENGAVEPDEVLALLFHSSEGRWVEDGRFTPEFHEAFERMLELRDAGIDPDLDADEAARRALVAEELDQGLPTVIFNDLSGLSATDGKILDHLLAAARLNDELFAIQAGAAALAHRLPAGDPASRRLFDRNWGPECQAPRTQAAPRCSAIPGAPRPRVDAYPAALQDDEGFCETLAGHEDAEALLSPFTVVRERNGSPAAVPITEAYADLMGRVAAKLETAADAVEDPEEQAFDAYLRAAARAFRDNDWEAADEAWARMNATNSKWYLRVAPDETYWDPCNRKAGFHLTLARINRASLAWQEKLTAVRQQMEDDLAGLIGRPYQAREVSFRMPDFIDIVINAGNDRVPLGAIIGQALPNWGPVANEGRGRTVAMTNIYTDPGSNEISRARAASLLDAGSMAHYTDDPEAALLGVILHEAAHNLGPSHEYSFKGRTADLAFGGPLATMLEELKAQTGAIHYVGFLRRRGVIDERQARQAFVAAFNWALGHVARGMYTATGRPNPYSHVSAIHVGFLMEEGAVSFDPEAPAANGDDRGAFTLHLDEWEQAAEKLMRRVGRIKARNDRRAAEKLVAAYVDDQDKIPHALIAERVGRHPRATFVYAIER